MKRALIASFAALGIVAAPANSTVPPTTAAQPSGGIYGVAVPVVPFTMGTSVAAAIAPPTTMANPTSSAAPTEPCVALGSG